MINLFAWNVPSMQMALRIKWPISIYLTHLEPLILRLQTLSWSETLGIEHLLLLLHD